jgi:hypothetical protein
MQIKRVIITLAIAFSLAAAAQWACSGPGNSSTGFPTSTATSTQTSTALVFPVWQGGADSAFTDATNSSGLSGIASGRCAWGDYNSDGYPDLLLDGARLFRNNGNGTFTEVTSAAGVGGPYSGGVWGDYNNDGLLDFYAINGAYQGDCDALFRNNGDGTFTNFTSQAGNPCDQYPTHGVAWGDFDRNGYLDLYLANYETGDGTAVGTPDQLFMNSGGTFTSARTTNGIASEPDMCGRGVACCDYDSDGDLDIYVANYRLNRNFLWQNDGTGHFTDVAQILGVEGTYYTDNVAEAWGHSIGADWGDLNADAYPDLIVGNLAHPSYITWSDVTYVYFNHGRGLGFTEFHSTSGIAYAETHSSPSWADYNCDGWLDFYITCIYEGRLSFLYKNRGLAPNTFANVSYASHTEVQNGWGCAWADYDCDGFPDLFVCSASGSQLFRNNGNSNSWLRVRPVCTASNRAGIGTRVRCTAGAFPVVREVDGGHGTGCQNDSTLLFGFGSYAGTVDVEVRWPNGGTKQILNQALNQTITITE